MTTDSILINTPLQRGELKGWKSKTVSTVFYAPWQTVETVSYLSLLFCTRLKPGVNEMISDQ